VSLLHVLLAVALALGGVRARLEEAMVEGWCGGVFVVDVTVTLLFRRPAVVVELALLIGTLPRALMCLDMFGQVTWPLELLVAKAALMYFGLGVLLPPGHGAKDIIVFSVDIRHGPLAGRGGRKFLCRQDLACSDTYGLAILAPD